MMTKFYYGCLDIKRFNYAHFILLPKKEGANCVTGFRPISLLNIVYKIVTKILTIRLNFVLNNLADSSQSRFIEGRFILDGIAAIQEFMSTWKRQKKRGAVLLKLDFAKAYDMLDWNYIFDVLKQEALVIG